MRPFTLDIDPADVDADGIADGNSSAGTSVTLDGALTSGGTFTSADGLGRQLAIKDNGGDDQSGATYTVTGTDADGKSITEYITGPTAGATVESSRYFKTVTAVAIASPAAGSTVDIGTVDEASTATIPLDHYSSVQPSAQATVTGTINFDIEVTLEDPQDVTEQSSLDWINDANFTGKTASLINQLGIPGNRAMRVVVNSYTNGAEVQVHVTQPNTK